MRFYYFLFLLANLDFNLPIRDLSNGLIVRSKGAIRRIFSKVQMRFSMTVQVVIR